MCTRATHHVRRHNIRSGKALIMSQANNGKPKESRRGRPAIGRDPVVAVRLPHETITDIDRLARTLGLSSRSEAVRYMIIRSAASIEPLEIEGRLSLGLPIEIRSKERKCFRIHVFEREPGKWRASIRRSDGSKVRSRQHACRPRQHFGRHLDCGSSLATSSQDNRCRHRAIGAQGSSGNTQRMNRRPSYSDVWHARQGCS